MELIKEFNFDTNKKRWLNIFADGVDQFEMMKKLSYHYGDINFNNHYNLLDFISFKFYRGDGVFLKLIGVEYKIENNKLVERGVELFSITDSLELLINNRVEPMNIFNFKQLFPLFFNNQTEDRENILTECNDFIIKYFLTQHSWIRFYEEFDLYESFQSIVKHKLFTHKRYWAHTYHGVPYKYHKEYPNLVYHFLNEYHECFYNQQNINPKLFEYVDDELYRDLPNVDHQLRKAVNICKIMNKKINCCWTVRKLNEFIDKHSFTLVNYFIKYIDVTFNIDPIFTRFANFSGLTPVKTFKDIATLGLINRNCIGGLGDSITNGDCCLFIIGDCVLEVSKVHNGGIYELTVSQMRRRFNIEADLSEINKQKKLIHDFNNTFSLEEKKTLFPSKFSSREPMGWVNENAVVRVKEDTTDYWLSETINYFNEELDKEQRQDYINKLIKLNEE